MIRILSVLSFIILLGSCQNSNASHKILEFSLIGNDKPALVGQILPELSKVMLDYPDSAKIIMYSQVDKTIIIELNFTGGSLRFELFDSVERNEDGNEVVTDVQCEGTLIFDQRSSGNKAIYDRLASEIAIWSERNATDNKRR